MGSIPVANPSPPRRLAFPRRALAVTVVLSTVVVGLVVVSAFAWPTGSNVDQTSWFNAGLVSEFATNDPVRFPEHRFWLVRLESGEFIALWQKSPHRGCTVPWRPDFEFMGKKGWFRDLCYNSTWDVTGTLAFGPAPRGMDRFPVRVEHGTVRVNVKRVILGPGGPPPAIRRHPGEILPPRLDIPPPTRYPSPCLARRLQSCGAADGIAHGVDQKPRLVADGETSMIGVRIPAGWTSWSPRLFKQRFRQKGG